MKKSPKIWVDPLELISEFIKDSGYQPKYKNQLHPTFQKRKFNLKLNTHTHTHTHINVHSIEKHEIISGQFSKYYQELYTKSYKILLREIK